jgi:cytidylate kinase
LRALLDPRVINNPVFILLSGPSESGKSTFGLQLLEDGLANRIKMLRVIREAQEQSRLPRQFGEDRPIGVAEHDPKKLLKSVRHDKDKSQIVQILKEQTLALMQQHDCPITVLESINSGWIISGLRQFADIRTLSVYIDSPTRVRITREAEAERVTLRKMAAEVIFKDIDKRSLGLTGIPALSDIYIKNEATIQVFRQFTHEVGVTVNKHTRDYSGTPFLYA